jgi:hypothetical protein
MSRRLLWASVLVAAALSGAVAYAIASERLFIGSRQGNWYYRYVESFDVHWVGPFLISSVLLAAALAAFWPLLQHRTEDAAAGAARVQEWTPVLAWCLLAMAIQALIRSLTPVPLGAVFASDASNSFYSVALEHDARTILGDFEALRPSWPLHAHSNLPGKLLLVRALTHLSTRPGVLAWLTVVLSNLGGLLLYRFVRDLFGDRFVASLSVILYLFMPARVYFFPLLNTLTPVVVLGCGCLLVRWLDGGRTVYAALLGIAVYGLILFEPTALVVGLLFTALIVRAIRRRRIPLPTAIRQMAIGVLALAATYAAVRAWFGFDLAAALRHVAAEAQQFNLSTQRPYPIWVRLNLLEFALGVGVGPAVLFWAALADGAASVRSRTHSSDPILLLGLSMLAVLGVVDALGVNRGEVMRLWIFLACFFQIPAAYVCGRLEDRLPFALLVITTLLQDAVGCARLVFLVAG